MLDIELVEESEGQVTLPWCMNLQKRQSNIHL